MAFCISPNCKFTCGKWIICCSLFFVSSAFGNATSTDAPDGKVRVVYPDGLADVMQHAIVPAFEQAMGDSVAGDHAPSVKLVSGIREGTRSADVLISASPQDNLQLMGMSQGDWVDWYVMFMQAPLVVGYDPASKFRTELRSMPWYRVAAKPGFRLGLADPNKDPKGRLVAKAIHRAVEGDKQQRLEKSLAANSEIVATQDSLRRLRAHELDAAFFYQPEAAVAGIPSVPIDEDKITTTYTVTILNRAPHPDRASAFVAFLLGEKGRQILGTSDSLTLMPRPVAFGNLVAVPGEVKRILDAAD